MCKGWWVSKGSQSKTEKAEICFKELDHMIVCVWGVAIMKSVGQAGRSKTQAGAEVEDILEAEFL